MQQLLEEFDYGTYCIIILPQGMLCSIAVFHCIVIAYLDDIISHFQMFAIQKCAHVYQR